MNKHRYREVIYGLCVTIATIVEDIFIFSQNFKLFFYEKFDFHLFVANCRGRFKPYVVVILGKRRGLYEAMVTGIQSSQNFTLSHSMG